jgi:uracil-DNA glycosylase
MKFSPRFIEPLLAPVMIVGLCPGRQRKKDQNFLVFHGNRTGDLVEEIIKDQDNIILTNTSNWIKQDQHKLSAHEGAKDLIDIVSRFKPRKIICLGTYAFNFVNDRGFTVPIVHLPHPSWVLRFNKDKNNYIKKFKHEL